MTANSGQKIPTPKIAPLCVRWRTESSGLQAYRLHLPASGWFRAHDKVRAITMAVLHHLERT